MATQTFPVKKSLPCQLQDNVIIQYRLTHISLASLFWGSRQSVDPDQTPQNAASDQGLHCIQEFQFEIK